MAASVQDGDEIITGINITPLVDIILVILIIFVVTASFVLRNNIPVELPRAQTGQDSSGGPLNLAIDRAGALYVNGRPATLDDLPAAILEAKGRLQGQPSVSAFVSADIQAQYGAFASVVDRLRLEGVTDIAMDTRPPERGDAAK